MSGPSDNIFFEGKEIKVLDRNCGGEVDNLESLYYFVEMVIVEDKYNNKGV